MRRGGFETRPYIIAIVTAPAEAPGGHTAIPVLLPSSMSRPIEWAGGFVILTAPPDRLASSRWRARRTPATIARTALPRGADASLDLRRGTGGAHGRLVAAPLRVHADH